ncbi:MAG: alpha-ketoglutarate-dependent dioxygenase AlkB [Ferruginibacter sp.]
MPQPLFNSAKNILPSDGEAFLFKNFFSLAESDRYLALLSEEIEWKQEPIKIYGKEVLQPRLTAFYGDTDKEYRYSGTTMQPHQWTNSLLEIREKVEALAGVKFTSALLNFYRDGKDSMGWHRDNEKVLGISPVIGSVSFGAARIFQFRNYKQRNMVIPVELTHGSFLLMKGETQHHWQHQLPKMKTFGGRINITFRIIN